MSHQKSILFWTDTTPPDDYLVSVINFNPLFILLHNAQRGSYLQSTNAMTWTLVAVCNTKT